MARRLFLALILLPLAGGGGAAAPEQPPGAVSVIVVQAVSQIRGGSLWTAAPDPRDGDGAWVGVFEMYEADFRVERVLAGPAVGRRPAIRYDPPTPFHDDDRPRLIMVVQTYQGTMFAQWAANVEARRACVPRKVVAMHRIVFARRPPLRNAEGDPCFHLPRQAP